jgi:protein subunit release factor A
MLSLRSIDFTGFNIYHNEYYQTLIDFGRRNSMGRRLLFSVTKKDFVVEHTRGSGKGGQKRNKTSSAVRITHPDSGAVGYSETERSQDQNKKLALERLLETKEWKSWHRLKTSFALQGIADMERELNRRVDEMVQDKNIKIEGIA